MAETKRVTDQYTISSPLIIIDGNLTVSGTTTSIDTVNSNISDNIVVFNEGETTVAADGGIALGESGFEIDRGFAADGSTIALRASIKYVEAQDSFAVFLGSNLTNLKIADPVTGSDAASKQYADNLVAAGSLPAGGIDGSLQYNNGGTINGDSNLLWNDSINQLSVGSTVITPSNITVSDTNGDLVLYGDGIGSVYIRSVVKIENSTFDPAPVAGNTHLYSKNPSAGESGIYYVNSDNSDELISKSKAIFFGFIF